MSKGLMPPRRDWPLWHGIDRVCPPVAPGDEVQSAEADIGKSVVVQGHQLGIGLFAAPCRKSLLDHGYQTK